MSSFKDKLGNSNSSRAAVVASNSYRYRKASLGTAVLGGAFVVGLGLSWALASSNSPKKDAKLTSDIKASSTKEKKSLVAAESSAVVNNVATLVKPNRKTAVYAFGYGQFGQLMLGEENDLFTPKRVNFAEDITSIATSSKTSALLTGKGNVYTGGCGMDGRLGTGITIPPLSAPDQTNPMRVPKIDSIVSIALGEFGGAAIRLDGKLFTWGRSWGGENGHTEESPGLPGMVNHEQKVVAVSRGRQHLAFVDEAGRLFSCGAGREGAHGLGHFANVSVPTRVKGPLEDQTVESVACGRESTFAITSDGKLYSWGNDDWGALGLGKIERRVVEPRHVTSLADIRVAQVACGENFTAVVSKQGDLYMCGRGADGQLATGNRDDMSFFVRVINLPGPVEKVSCGGGHVSALLKDGSLYVWGRGRNGQLGRSDHVESVAAPRLTPVECSFFKGMKVLQTACGGDHTVVLVEE